MVFVAGRVVKLNGNKGSSPYSRSRIVKLDSPIDHSLEGKVGVSEKARVDLTLPPGEDLVEMPADAANRFPAPEPGDVHHVSQAKLIRDPIELCRSRPSRRIILPRGSELLKPGPIHAARRSVSVKEQVSTELEIMRMERNSIDILHSFNKPGKTIVVSRDEMNGEMGKLIPEFLEPVDCLGN